MITQQSTSVNISADNKEWLRSHIPIAKDPRHTSGMSTKLNILVEQKRHEERLLEFLEWFVSYQEPNYGYEPDCGDEPE